MSPSQPLFDNLSNVASAIGAASHIILFLDFDGTLAPIVQIPAEAKMPAATSKILETLARRKDLSPVIVSGRALLDVRARVGLLDLIYAGNHGLEISGPGVNFVEPGAAQRIKALGDLYRHLRTRLREIPGVEIENKVLTASVHYRRATPQAREQAREIVHSGVASMENLFWVARGHQVFEVRPRVDWHKGTAVRWIQEASGWGDALAIYVGDDVTDEDAFPVLTDGITVSVGNSVETTARYFLEHQHNVPTFLEWLSRMLTHSPKPLSKSTPPLAELE